MPPDRRLRLAVLADFREEEWTSMELAAEMLLAQTVDHQDIEATRIQPSMLRTASLMPGLRSNPRLAHNLDRAVARYLQYSRNAGRLRDDFDVFHIVDHSYGHLALCLPEQRTGIYCHDIDAFRGALEPDHSTESWRRALSLLLVAGLRRASIVFYSTNAVRSEIERFELVRPERLVQAPLGVAEEFVPAPTERMREARLLLHVGSVVPRKNPTFLLRLTAELRKTMPDLQLLQVGGTWQDSHLELIRSLNLERSVSQIRGISRVELAKHYRRASVVLMPSRAEGFGIPVAEALACGAVVVASDLGVLREVGADAVIYCPPDDLLEWTQRVRNLLLTGNAPSRELRLSRASLYSWRQHAALILDTYRRRSEVLACAE